MVIKSSFLRERGWGVGGDIEVCVWEKYKEREREEERERGREGEKVEENREGEEKIEEVR